MRKVLWEAGAQGDDLEYFIGVGIVNARDAIPTSRKLIIPSRVLSLNHITGVFML